jgi:hypothetical protein
MQPADAAKALLPTAGIVVGLCIAAQMLADIASLKIALVAGFGIDAGASIYPLTFTLRNLVHQRFGVAAARIAVILAAAVNLFMGGFFHFAARRPAAVVWSIFFANVILKDLVTRASLPGINIVKEPRPERRAP